MNFGQIHLLLIEDNAGDARLIQEALNETRESPVIMHRVERIADGLELLRAGGIDAVLLDLYLPDGEGLNTVHRVLAKAENVPVLVLTVANDKATAFRALQAGAQDYLFKDELRGENLARALRYAIERQRLLTAVKGNSFSDTLTGLFNRDGFIAIGQQYLHLARSRNEPALAIVAELQGAEAIHGQWGSYELDAALSDVAASLRSAFTPAELLGFFGHQRFGVLILGHTDSAACRARIEAELLKRKREHRPAYPLAPTLRAAQFDPYTKEDIHTLLSRAERPDATRL